MELINKLTYIALPDRIKASNCLLYCLQTYVMYEHEKSCE